MRSYEVEVRGIIVRSTLMPHERIEGPLVLFANGGYVNVATRDFRGDGFTIFPKPIPPVDPEKGCW